MVVAVAVAVAMAAMAAQRVVAAVAAQAQGFLVEIGQVPQAPLLEVVAVTHLPQRVNNC